MGFAMSNRWSSWGSGWGGYGGWSGRYGSYQPVQTRSVIKHHRFDEINYADARKTQGFEKNITDLFIGDPNSGRAGYDNAPELVEDLYYAFLKFQPHIQPIRNIKPDARLNAKFLKAIMEMPEFHRIHDLTAGDPVMATLAVMNMFDTLREAIKNHEQLVLESNESKRGGRGCGPSGRCRTDGQGDPEDAPPADMDDTEAHSQGAEGSGGDADSFDREFQDELKKLNEQDMADLDEMFQDFQMGPSPSLDKGANELEELEATRKSFGLEAAEWRQTSPERRMEIAKMLNTPQMKALADIMGKMVPYAMGQQATKLVDIPNHITNVEMGSNLRKILKGQLALLSTEETKIEFYRKYLNGELLQFQTRGVENLGKGPLVICVDNSGSMGGGPENWAKGVCEALRRICAKEGRDCFVMFFEVNRHRMRFDFPKGHADVETIMKYLSISAGGGTEFDGVLTEALARCTTQFDEGGKSKADIVFITDGESYLDDAWIEKFNDERKRIGSRVFSVYVSGAYDSYTAPLELLNKFSDTVINVNDLSPESMKEVFKSV